MASSIKVRIFPEPGQPNVAVEKAAFRNHFHAAARISKDAKASIRKARDPAPVGAPPSTRGRPGRNIRGAIRFAADKEGAIIGPQKSWVGRAGEAHEFGGKYKDDFFEPRPFMWPALVRNVDRFARDWSGSIGG